jgi:AraC family transcriptional regulator
LNEADLSLDELRVRRSERAGRTNTFGQMQKAPYPALPIPHHGKEEPANGRQPCGGCAMSKFIAVEELPQYAPGELKLDSSAVGRPDFRMRVFRYAPSDIWVPPTEDFLIVVYRQGATAMNRRVTGAWKQERVSRGITTLLTRAEPSHWRWANDIEVSHFYISPAYMMKTASEAFDRDVGAIELHDLLGIDDPVLSWINEQMAHEVAAGGPGGRLCYDALSLQASIHIIRKYAAVKFKMPSAQGHFRPAHARLIEDYIQQNISRNITLDELAAICNCTPIQFARKFHAHYGIRPHAFVQKQKVEQACRHLRRDNLALKEIALLSGFADQSHLNRVFRRYRNCTPAEYRKGASGT